MTRPDHGGHDLDDGSLNDRGLDRLSSQLRAALDADAARIQPSDRLAEIRARTQLVTAPAPSRGRSWGFSALAAAAVVAMVVLGVRWGASAPADPAGRGLPSPSTTSAIGDPPAQAIPAGRALPVFALARITEPGSGAAATQQRWALQRWFVPSDIPTAAPAPLAVRAAVRWAMGPGLTEPGTTAPFNGTVATEVTVTPELITITLSNGGHASADAELARISLQQMVWTAQAAYGHRVPVTFRLADGADLLLGRFPAGGRYDRPDSDRIATEAAPVWIDGPGLGAALPAGRPVTLTGLADVPERPAGLVGHARSGRHHRELTGEPVVDRLIARSGHTAPGANSERPGHRRSTHRGRAGIPAPLHR